jgi:hypothetical protein
MNVIGGGLGENQGRAAHHLGSTALLGVMIAGFYGSFASYGLNLDDEGTVLFQILRTWRGERPYLDFHTGYTPAMFYLNATLMDVFGVSVLPLRWFLVAVNTATVLLIYRLALRLSPPLESALAALAYALFLPFFAGQFASFNIPYPAWYAVCAWMLTAWASVRAAESGRLAYLILAGGLAGLTFSFKPNTGVLALGAVVLARLLATAPLAGRVGATCEAAVLGAAAFGVWAYLTFDIFTEHFLLLGVPPLLLILAAGRVRGRLRRAGQTRPLSRGFVDIGALLLGFAIVVTAWLTYFVSEMGIERFGREVLLLGAGVERIYLLYYPDPSGWSVAALAGLSAVWLVPLALERDWISPRSLGWVVAAGVVVGLVALAFLGLAPEGFLLSIALQFENLSYFVIPALLAGCVLGLVVDWVRRAGREERGDGDLLAVRATLVVYGLLLFIQLYPRIDFMHVVISMPSALVLAAGVLAEVQRRWWRVLGDPRVPTIPHGRAWLAIRVGIVLPVLVGLAVRAVPFVDARFATEDDLSLRETTSLGFSAMPIEIERDRDHDFQELAATARFVSESTGADEPVLVFPALGIIPFLADRRTPVEHDYFFAGRPSHADEARMVEEIDRARPPLVVTLGDRLGYFSAAPAYYFILRDYIRRNYVLVRRFGRFEVFARRDLSRERPQWATLQSTGGDSLAFADGRFREQKQVALRIARSGGVEDLRGAIAHLADVDRSIRGLWIDAMLGVAGRQEGGLKAVEVAVAPDARSRLLFVRALGEWGGVEVLPYLEAVFLGEGGRLRWEAARSINFVLARRLADRFRFSDPPSGPLWGLPPMGPSDLLVEQIDDFAERQRIGPLAAVTAAGSGRGDLAPRLEYFESERETTWWRMVSALSLVELGHPEHLRTMIDALNTGTLAGQYVPALLLDPEIVPGAQVAVALEETLRVGTPEERETVLWMVPFLEVGEQSKKRILVEEALRDGDPAVRSAAQWAAGTLDHRSNVDEAMGQEGQP